jgi:hypothetical protein
MNTKTLLATAIALLQFALAFGQGTTAKKEQFSFQKANLLKIDNSFGDVTVSTYNGAMIDVLVEIVLDLKSKDDQKKVLEKIKIVTTESAGEVRLVTENKINGMNAVRSFEINYTIKLPQGVALEVRNQFGDVVIGDVKSGIDLNVQHGSCTVNSAQGKSNKIKLQFGDLRIENTPGADIDVQHGDFRGGNLGNLTLSQMFGDCVIRQLSGQNKVKVQHGEFSVDKLESGLKSLDINGQFSTISLGNITGNSYNITLDGSFSNFEWDDVLKSSRGGVTVISELKEMHRNKVELSSSEASSPINKITIDASHSDVKLY